MNRQLTTVLTTAAAVGIATTASHGQFYSLSTSEGLAESVSDNGIVAGSFNAPEYFTWSLDDGYELIGGVPPGGGVGGQAKISNNGRRVSGTVFNTASGFHEMAIYDRSTGMWTALGGIGGSSGSEISSGWAISGDGLHAAGLGWVSAGGAHATQWSAGVGTFDLGSTVPGNSSRANGLNLDGTVVVGWQDGAGRQGAAWVNGLQELIFLPDSSVADEAFDVSGDGQWVTGIGFGAPFQAATTYRYNTVTNVTETIPNLEVGGESRLAGTGITDDGATIVGGTWGFGPATLGVAVIWREGIGTVLMSEYLDEIGVAYPAGFSFAFTTGISSNGEWLTGWGNDGTGLVTWVVRTPPCPDLNGSGVVDFGDILAVIASWGPCAGTCDADFDNSGDVGFGDILYIIARWGMTCP